MKKISLPLVSVIIPTRNSGKTLRRCLSAIKNQTYKKIEIIIVDSSSTDNTKKITESYAGITWYAYNGGLLGSRILGITKAKGIYVLLLDSDQILFPKCIEDAVRMIKKTHLHMLALEESVYEIKSVLQWLYSCDRKVIETVKDLNPETSAILPRFFVRSLLCKAISAVPPSIIATVGGPDHAILYHESWKLSNRIGILPNGVLHMEASSIYDLLRKCYRWGYTGYSAKTQSEYLKMMKSKERFRKGLFTHGLYIESVASIFLLLLKGVPYMIGYWRAILSHVINAISPKSILQKMFVSAVAVNHENIESLLTRNKNARFIDLGCADGVLSMRFAKRLGTHRVYGIDVCQKDIDQAKTHGVRVIKSDLNTKLPFPSSSFDVVYTNQVIEHILDSDSFLLEIKRILKVGGYAIISTENASSWCNIAASILGWQIFSLTNFSGLKRSIGNPFAIHRDDENEYASWRHVRIYNIDGLKEYLQVAGFTLEKVSGAGYFPFSAELGRIDVRHAHFITFKVRKKS